MIDWFFATLKTYPEIAIFLTLALGYYFGKFTFKGIGLGAVTATLLSGVLIGQIGITISQPLKAFSFLMELSPQKARILLMLALMNTTDPAKLQQIFMQY